MNIGNISNMPNIQFQPQMNYIPNQSQNIYNIPANIGKEGNKANNFPIENKKDKKLNKEVMDIKQLFLIEVVKQRIQQLLTLQLLLTHARSRQVLRAEVKELQNIISFSESKRCSMKWQSMQEMMLFTIALT